MRLSYEEACDRGYDGPDPFTERRHARRVARNNMLDCRDPDHDDRLCPYCNGDDEAATMNDYPSERVLADIFATAQDLTAAGFAVEMHTSNLCHSLVRVDVWDSAHETNALAPAEEGETAPLICSTGDNRVGWVVYDHNDFSRLFALHDAMCELLRKRINVEEVEL